MIKISSFTKNEMKSVEWIPDFLVYAASQIGLFGNQFLK